MPHPSPTAPVSPMRGNLTVPRIVFLVIAAASPLAAMVATLPLAFTLGAGSATPAMYLVAGTILLCFSVGYAAMSRRIVSAGGLYTYIAAGLGRTPAVAAGFVALLAYNALAVMLVATFSYFTHLVLDAAGIGLPWPAYAACAIALTGYLGYRRIDVSAKFLGLLVGAELLVLAVVDVVMVGHLGASAFPLEALNPVGIGQAALGLGLMFAFTSFLGFEAAALYGEESRNPRRTVPLATYTSIAVVVIFYGLTSWITVGAIGPADVRSAAAEQLGDLLLNLTAEHLGDGAAEVLTVLLLTSLFATLLACHNSTNRLVFALGRDGVLSRRFGQVHPRHNSPSRASLCQTTVNVVVIGAFALGGLDPYLTLSVSMSGLGTLGLVALQAVTAFAVLGFFRHRPDRDRWRTGIAPLLGGIGLCAAVILILVHYSDLTGVDNPVVNALPVTLVLAALAGVVRARRLRRRDPATYAAIGTHTTNDSEPTPLTEEITK